MTWGRSEYGLRHARLLIPVASAVVLVLIPTLFAVFPSLPGLPRWDRIWIMAGWLGIAILGTILTAKADSKLHIKVDGHRRALEAAEQRLAIGERFSAMLNPASTGLPQQYGLTVYAESVGYLIPVYPRSVGENDPAIFANGLGATGQAWNDPEQTFVYFDDGVSSPDQGLNLSQESRYAGFNVVAATVIHDEETDTPLGVLSDLGVKHDSYFEDFARILAFEALADSIAWLMPNAIKWMLPSEQELN